MKFITFIFFLILNIQLGVCQSTPSSDVVPYDIFIHKLDSLMQINEARVYAKNNFKAYHQYWGKDIPENYDNLIKLAVEKTNENHPLVAYIIHKKGVYLYSKDEEAAIFTFKKALDIRQSTLGNAHSEVGNSFYTIGITYKKIAQIESAIEYLKLGLDTYAKAKDSIGISKCYEQLGSSYTLLNEYETAEGYYYSMIEILKKTYHTNHPRIARLNNFLGVLKIKQNQFEAAYNYLKKSIQIYEKNIDHFPYDAADYYQNLALVLNELGQTEEAKKANFKVLELHQKKYGLISREVVDVYENIAVYYISQGKFNKTFNYLQKALEIQQQLVGNKKHIKYNSLYHNFGANHLETKNYPIALDYFQKAIQQQIINFDNNDIFSNPDLSTANFLGTKPNLLKDFDLKASTFTKWYQQSQNIDHLKAAYETYIVASELIDLMRGEFTAKGSKLFWMEQTYPIFERAIAVSLLLSETTSDPIYKKQVFTLMEKNKAILLLESLQASQGQIFANIPDSLLEQQQMLTESIADKKRDIIELQQEEETDSLIGSLESERFQLELKLQDWEKTIEAAYPSYSQLTKDIQVLSLADVQGKFLKPNQAILEYFMGDSVVYLAAISNSNYAVHRLPKANIDSAIQKLQSGLLAPQNGITDPPKTYQDYTEAAHQLYQLLIAPAQAILTEKEELIIVPDASLAAIPFDVLLSQAAPKKVFYAPDYLKYLLHDFSINYGYSVTLLAKQQQIKAHQTPHFFMGFAPAFEAQKMGDNNLLCAGQALNPLPSNEQEIATIASYFPSKNFLNQDASVANFQAKAAQCRILHLATHACVDSENPTQSRIYFTDDYLYAHELYHLNLQADMVVLSACETGVGEYQKGEGVMNLARGFAYSGTPSITMSLWSVNDETTAQLMQHYYQYIEAGLPTHQALRAAKLDFLEQQVTTAKLHPFYWAAFVQVGNTSPIQVESASSCFFCYFILGLLILSALYIFYKKRKRQA